MHVMSLRNYYSVRTQKGTNKMLQAPGVEPRLTQTGYVIQTF